MFVVVEIYEEPVFFASRKPSMRAQRTYGGVGHHSEHRWFIISSTVITNMDSSSEAYRRVIKNLSSQQLSFEECSHPLHLSVIQSNTCCSCSHNPAGATTKRVVRGMLEVGEAGCEGCCHFIAFDNYEKIFASGLGASWWADESQSGT